MRKLIILLCIWASAVIVDGRPVISDPEQSFFIGTYTDGEGRGIYEAHLNISTGKISIPDLVISSDNPSFLCLTNDNKFLLAVNEIVDNNGNKNGYVESFAVYQKGEHLKRLCKVPSGGAVPCYVSSNADKFVLVANYTGGNVALLSMDENGMLKLTDVRQHDGSGPVKGRQEKAHVHSALFEPGTDRIFVADLGTDKINVYRLDKKSQKLIPASVSEIKLSPGSGPRHVVINPLKKLLYVACELSNSVSVIDLNDEDKLKEIETVSALPDDFKKENYSADIHMTKDGRFLYVSNRGLNSMAVFEINQKDGKLKLISQEPTRGVNPRNFTLSPDENYLLVANQNSQNIVAFRRDKKTGKLTFSDEVKAFTPVCLLFHK